MQTTALLKKEAPKGAMPTIGKFTNPLQRKAIGEEEDALQMKQNPLQLQTSLDEEEPLQMKQAPIQLMDGLDDEDEEPLQMKQNPLQRMGDEDDELLQKKESPLQLKRDGQNSLQLKQATDNPLQLQAEETAATQPKKNNTGLPDNLKSGVEALSGYSMDDVKVHYNSDKPAQLQALAYAQGTDIHVAPGQEQHLPHEAWHVVQQKQGRVQPTMQMKAGVEVNDDEGLEREADVNGMNAFLLKIDQTTRNGEQVNSEMLQTHPAPLNKRPPVQLLEEKRDNKKALKKVKEKFDPSDHKDIDTCFKEALTLNEFNENTKSPEAFNKWRGSETSSEVKESTKLKKIKKSKKEEQNEREALGFGTPIVSTHTRPEVAQNVTEIDENVDAYKRFPATYAISIIANGGEISRYGAANNSPSIDGKPQTVNVSVTLRNHKVLIHYHPHVGDGVGESNVHAKLKVDSTNRDGLSDLQLTSMGMFTPSQVKELNWVRTNNGWIYS